MLATLAGCGSTQQQTATEQLVLSDAVDRAVGNVDFTPLTGLNCWLDDENIGGSSKSASFVNKGYIISSLRNQLVAAGCNLVESRGDADVVVEARVGTLGSDHHEVTYGFPSNNLVSQAAAFMPTAPPVPPLPDIAFAQKDDQTGASKLGVFAYDAKSGAAIWQSGIVTAQSSGRETWVLGVGPFQSGTIYEKPRFAGSRMRLPLIGTKDKPESQQQVNLDQPFNFGRSVIAGVPDTKEEVSAKPAEDSQTR